MGFSDYVWKSRFEKDCEFLKERTLSDDEISLAVGYIHSSSFCRKFKQETGLSQAVLYMGAIHFKWLSGHSV